VQPSGLVLLSSFQCPSPNHRSPSTLGPGVLLAEPPGELHAPGASSASYDGRVAHDRLGKGEFYDLVAGMDDEALKKILWTVYWRGAGPVRDRIAELLGVASEPVAPSQPDPVAVLQDVEEFVALARAGAYIGGDRRVTPAQRTRWRYTFRDLVKQSLQALHDDDEESVRAGAAALAVLIDLAVDTSRVDFFRSDDPVEAAQFVVSDAVRAIWIRTRMVYGTSVFAERASAQLLRWESQYGWTRRGEGRVAAREVPLAQVLAELLVTPDLWNEVAVKYVAALDNAPQRRIGSTSVRRQDLKEWHALLSQQLAGSDHEHLIDRLSS
jgi:hypothetical protein